MDNDDFLTTVHSVPDTIGDAPVVAPAVDGMPPPMNPLRPWQDINVEGYMPLALMLLRQAFKMGAKKADEPAYELEDFEVDALAPALREAVQKCLYDLKLAKIAGNPYVALVLAVGGLVAVKWMAIQAMRAMADETASNPALPPRDGVSQPLPLSANQPPTSAGTSTGNIRMPESGAASSSADSPEAGRLFSSETEFELVDE